MTNKVGSFVVYIIYRIIGWLSKNMDLPQVIFETQVGFLFYESLSV